MILFPAIDLIEGRVVRLERGDRARMKVYSDDPASVAAEFARRGAEWVHVVDLSAAFGESEAVRAANRAAIEEICALGSLKVDVGGGVRSLERIDELALAGASRIALGTAIVRDAAFASQAAARYGALLTADVAARDGVVKVDGWREGAGVSALDLVARLADAGFRHLVFTDIARDGMQSGIDVSAYRRIAEAAGFPVVASGGIASLSDVEELAREGSDVIEGCIAGRALYEGAFSLEGALAAACGEERSVPC
ncbi:1-(5-phosphoribosyl)-5-[(5-phosphoribosylamino)methylideneamino] imidazole-4-carboxamide isomerase [uncultured Slackia sp.]|uniref:1-(5-phosphoribosyl)-5-[(5- phosphoribosylamino)methylideneamino]imidazole-4- carboxamide isomerase n=1 Tax=uncultured Slackia sp. TaxID=665903 RepID=UPI0026E0EB79|nr:1-(5-phosphoribosyl)-5-[(5-phosphoribosylamino)methylideneamino] imidazole-4-carboxamide isomerase [uncultured Slackia sp.]